MGVAHRGLVLHYHDTASRNMPHYVRFARYNGRSLPHCPAGAHFGFNCAAEVPGSSGDAIFNSPEPSIMDLIHPTFPLNARQAHRRRAPDLGPGFSLALLVKSLFSKMHENENSGRRSFRPRVVSLLSHHLRREEIAAAAALADRDDDGELHQGLKVRPRRLVGTLVDPAVELRRHLLVASEHQAQGLDLPPMQAAVEVGRQEVPDVADSLFYLDLLLDLLDLLEERLSVEDEEIRHVPPVQAAVLDRAVILRTPVVEIVRERQHVDEAQPAARQDEVREGARGPAVAVVEGMDLHEIEVGDACLEERVELLLGVQPPDEGAHHPGDLVCRRPFIDDLPRGIDDIDRPVAVFAARDWPVFMRVLREDVLQPTDELVAHRLPDVLCGVVEGQAVVDNHLEALILGALLARLHEGQRLLQRAPGPFDVAGKVGLEVGSPFLEPLSHLRREGDGLEESAVPRDLRDEAHQVRRDDEPEGLAVRVHERQRHRLRLPTGKDLVPLPLGLPGIPFPRDELGPGGIVLISVRHGSSESPGKRQIIAKRIAK